MGAFCVGEHRLKAFDMAYIGKIDSKWYNVDEKNVLLQIRHDLQGMVGFVISTLQKMLQILLLSPMRPLV